MSCCGAARRAREQATSLQVAAQQEAERQAQRAADDLAATVRVAAEEAVASFAIPDTADTSTPKPRRKRVRKSDDA
jgi:F0F1-type ATP synthase membrane subunit b/b'